MPRTRRNFLPPEGEKLTLSSKFSKFSCKEKNCTDKNCDYLDHGKPSPFERPPQSSRVDRRKTILEGWDSPEGQGKNLTPAQIEEAELQDSGLPSSNGPRIPPIAGDSSSSKTESISKIILACSLFILWVFYEKIL